MIQIRKMSLEMSIVRTKGLTHRFKIYDDEGNVTGYKTAVDNLDISVEEGSFIAILGKNGSGKSTLAKHINALLFPTEGVIYIEGADTNTEKDLLKIRKTVGMVFQNPDNQIVSTVIEEDVAFGPENLGVPQDELTLRVKDALEKVGMTSYAKHAPNKLSGGQKQRIAIAGVLAMKPKAIVLDEATAMLDPQGRREVLATLIKLHKEEGITLILITHHMEEAAEADRVMVMNQGKLVMDDTPENIFKKMYEVEGYGLRVPNTVKLRFSLMQKNVEMPGKLALSEEELAEQISSVLKGGRYGA